MPSVATLKLLFSRFSFKSKAVFTSDEFAFAANAVVTSVAFAFKANPGTVGKDAVPPKSPAN